MSQEASTLEWPRKLNGGINPWVMSVNDISNELGWDKQPLEPEEITAFPSDTFATFIGLTQRYVDLSLRTAQTSSSPYKIVFQLMESIRGVSVCYNHERVRALVGDDQPQDQLSDDERHLRRDLPRIEGRQRISILTTSALILPKQADMLVAYAHHVKNRTLANWPFESAEKAEFTTITEVGMGVRGFPIDSERLAASLGLLQDYGLLFASNELTTAAVRACALARFTGDPNLSAIAKRIFINLGHEDVAYQVRIQNEIDSLRRRPTRSLIFAIKRLLLPQEQKDRLLHQINTSIVLRPHEFGERAIFSSLSS